MTFPFGSNSTIAKERPKALRTRLASPPKSGCNTAAFPSIAEPDGPADVGVSPWRCAGSRSRRVERPSAIPRRGERKRVRGDGRGDMSDSAPAWGRGIMPSPISRRNRPSGKIYSEDLRLTKRSKSRISCGCRVLSRAAFAIASSRLLPAVRRRQPCRPSLHALTVKSAKAFTRRCKCRLDGQARQTVSGGTGLAIGRTTTGNPS